MDLNRQAWSAAANLLMHPPSLYVGGKADRTFAQRGEPFDVNAIAADLDGSLDPGCSLQIRFARWTRGAATFLPLPLRPEMRQG
jgi:hypothetical protein